MHLIGVVKENKLIQRHGINNLKVKDTGCYISLTYATSMHYTPPYTHTHTHTLKRYIIKHMFKEHTFHKPKKYIEV